MFPLIWLLLAIYALVRDLRNFWWIYVVTAMWINYDVRLGSVTLLNILSMFVIICVILKRSKRKAYTNLSEARKPLLYVITYIIVVNVIFLFLGTGTIISGIVSIKSSILSWVLFLSILYIPAGNSQKSSSIIGMSLLILSIYGILCYVTASNPYADMISNYLSKDNQLQDLVEGSMNDARGALKGRITGTSMYTIQYAILLTLIISLLLVECKQSNKKFFLVIIALAFVNIYLTGSRGPLLAITVGVILYFAQILSIKKKIILIIVFLSGYLIFENLLNYYIGSLASDEVGGSSFEQRTIQLYGAYTEVEHSLQAILFGRGPSFVSDYLKNYGVHPLAINFESTPVHGLATYGIIGLIFVFLGSAYIMWKTSYILYKKKIIAPNTYHSILSLIIVHFIYSSLVGTAYDNLYVIIYLMIIKNSEQPFRNVKIKD